MRPKPGLVDLPEAELNAAALPATRPAPIATIPQGTAAPALASQASEEILPASSIILRQASLRMVLDIYADLAGARLEIDPRVRELNAQISLETTQSLTRSDAARVLEQAMQQQAGLDIKRSEKKYIEVTLDERAKTKPIR